MHVTPEDILGLHAGLVPDGIVGVALSGGADSTALFVALVRLGFRCEALHCNFHLRGSESDRDEAFVRALCSRYGILLHVHEPDVSGYMTGHGCSLEMACRDLRYEWVRAMARERCYGAVAVAHHSDDNVETMLLNLFRGSGVTGLRGMQEVNGIIIRPLLRSTRVRAEEYLRSVGETWVDDSTNAGIDFRRNRIRNVILPAVREQIPEAVAGMRGSLDILAEESRFIEAEIAGKRDIYLSENPVMVDVAAISTHEGDLASFVLWRLIRSFGVTRSMADSIIRASGTSGRRFGPFELHGGELLLLPENDGGEESLDSLADGPWHLRFISPEYFRPVRNPRKVWFDASILDGNPCFRLEPWRQGMRIEPFGMKRGSRKLSDVFSDRHLSLSQKMSVRVLTRNGTVIWIPGIMASCHFPVTASTLSVVELEIT